MNQRNLERVLTAARDAGSPPDQIKNLLRGGYVPQPKQLKFHAFARQCDRPRDGDDPGGPTEVAQAGARGGAKSHAALAQAVLDDCERYAGLKWLYLRSIGKSAKESFEDLLIRLDLMKYYIPSRSALELPNSSRVLLGGFRTDSDIQNYLGIEYDGAIIDDAHMIAPKRLREIGGSVRTSKEGWRPRTYFSFNPGGVGHSYLKKRFVDPWRAGKLNGTRMVFSLPEDNAMLNPEYKAYLDGLDGWLYRAWRLGDFDVAAGQFFTNWSHDLHVIDPFPIPSNWDVWASLDYGMSHNNAIYILAEGDGVIYVVGELVERQWLVPQHATAFESLIDRLNIANYRLKVFVAGHDVFTQRPGETESKSIADQWQRQGWKLTHANQDRINGAGEIRHRLGNANANPVIPPTLKIFNTCARLIECIPSLEHDPNRPEDVLKVDCDPDDGSGGDDCVPAGTMITTTSGHVPVEYIAPGAMVETRHGPRPVAAIWNNRLNATVITTQFTNGAELTATPNHPVWIDGRGFAPLDALRYGDIIIPYRNQSKRGKLCKRRMWTRSLLTELPLDDTRRQSSDLIDAITHLAGITPSEAYRLCTSRYGSQFTERFPLDAIYTMPTGIRSITRLTTWCVSLLASMLGSTSKTLSGLPVLVNILRPFVHWQAPGMGLMLAGLGTASTVNKFGKTESRQPSSASSAVLNLIRLYQIVLGSALMPASQSGGGPLELTTSSSLASDATQGSRVTNMIRGDSVPVRVQTVTGERRADTYALHVYGAHEFFANGVLVKNCYDGVRYGVMHKFLNYGPPTRTEFTR